MVKLQSLMEQADLKTEQNGDKLQINVDGHAYVDPVSTSTR
jgi:hypothetical protein